MSRPGVALDVLYACRDNYAMTLGVSVESLCANNQAIDRLTVFVLDDEIGQPNQDRLRAVGAKYGRDVVFIDTAGFKARLIELGVEPHKGTYTTYFKLLAVNTLPAGADRVLYLDCDTIIVGSLARLGELALDQAACSATYDCLLNDYKTMIGLAPNDHYYNCGVILIDRAEWRRQGYEERVLNHLTAVRQRYHIVDQDIMNVLFHDQFHYLDLRYDINPSFEIYGVENTLKLYRLSPPAYNSAAEVKAELAQPVVYHCMGAMTGRPWEKGNAHPWNDLFDHYKALTPWAATPKSTPRLSALFRIQRALYKALPRSLYLPIHRAVQHLWLSRNDAGTRLADAE
ncbi:MAG: hypothetical protein LBK42_04425 [Propionibacteriaceae bacterium]|jgi:lipopolysaccharide biosynthesis glycosyltransferase|nr:hypothetical protein [Propionibacteriaceae bacterium]